MYIQWSPPEWGHHGDLFLSIENLGIVLTFFPLQICMFVEGCTYFSVTFLSICYIILHFANKCSPFHAVDLVHFMQ